MDDDPVVRRALEPLQLRSSHERHAIALDLSKNLSREFPLESVHRKIAPIDELGSQVQTPKRFTHLERNEPGSYHHRPSGPMTLDETPDANGVAQVPQAEDSLDLVSGHPEGPAVRAGRRLPLWQRFSLACHLR